MPIKMAVGGVNSVDEARAGHHLPPQPLSSGKNVFEELGPGFTPLTFDSGVSDVQAARSLNMPLKVIRDRQSGGREAYETRLFLVRPDQYVVWTGDKAPANTLSIMSEAIGIPDRNFHEKTGVDAAA